MKGVRCCGALLGGCCGTIRGATSVRWALRVARDERAVGAYRLSWRFSVVAATREAACSAMASATGSGPSPSKNLAIAIYMVYVSSTQAKLQPAHTMHSPFRL